MSVPPTKQALLLGYEHGDHKKAHVNQVYSDRAVALFYIKIQEPSFLMD